MDFKKADVTVECPAPTAGTLEWLLCQKLRIVIHERTDGLARQATLLGDEDEPLARLAVVWRDHTSGRGSNRRLLLRKDSPWRETHFAWTDAAWVLLYQIRDHAAALLEEPAAVASEWKVSFSPSDETVRELTSRQREDLLARQALYDHALDNGAFLREGYEACEPPAGPDDQPPPSRARRIADMITHSGSDDIPF